VFQAFASCAGCHAGSAPAGNLDLSAQGSAYTSLVGVKASGGSCGASGETRVLAGDPNRSLLYTKVAGTQDCGSQMPTSSADVATLVQSWIQEGAPNN
jgi:hypothetical protein